MTEPTVHCLICQKQLAVKQDGRTRYPVPLAKRRLRRLCAQDGCPSEPKYRPGFSLGERPKGMS